MSDIKSGALLLLLGIPFALYAAWQVNGAVPIDTGAPEPPADKSASKEQLAAASAKSGVFSTEARKAVEVTWKYGSATPVGNSSDATVAEVMKTAAARSADLNDLDRFLSVKNPTFTGNARLKLQYAEWTKEQATLETSTQTITDWIERRPEIKSADDAKTAMESIGDRINQYERLSQFADKNKATIWRLKARLRIIDALTVLADSQYKAAVSAELPLKEGAEGTTAIKTLQGLKEQLAALATNLKQIDADKIPLSAPDRAAAETKSGGADDCTARTELLALFANSDLFTNASGATAWLKQVAAQYAKTKDAKVQALIRKKVQEFANAFIPLVASLDDDVLIRGKPVPRTTVKIKFEKEPGGGPGTPKVLLADPAAGFDEIAFAQKPPGSNTLVLSASSEHDLKDLKPTEASKAAIAYNAARAKLADRTTAPRWTPESVGELKKVCEAQKDLVDQLRTLKTGAVEKIATRVAGLVAGMDACKELFEVVP